MGFGSVGFFGAGDRNFDHFGTAPGLDGTDLFGFGFDNHFFLDSKQFTLVDLNCIRQAFIARANQRQGQTARGLRLGQRRDLLYEVVVYHDHISKQNNVTIEEAEIEP